MDYITEQNIKKYINGDKEAFAKLLDIFKPQIDRAIRSIKSNTVWAYGQTPDDLYSVAVIECSKTFKRLLDEKKKNIEKFCVYRDVRFGIMKYCNDTQLIHSPRSIMNMKSKILKSTNFLTEKLLRCPTEEEIVEHSGISKKNITTIRTWFQPPVQFSNLTDKCHALVDNREKMFINGRLF